MVTCGTSMLSVGRIVASLLLRGSNSNAAVKTMANPGGVGGMSNLEQHPISYRRVRRENSRFMFMFGVLYMKCMKSWVVLMRIWSPL